MHVKQDAEEEKDAFCLMRGRWEILDLLSHRGKHKLEDTVLPDTRRNPPVMVCEYVHTRG